MRQNEAAMKLIIARWRRWAASVPMALGSMLVVDLLGSEPVYWDFWAQQIHHGFSLSRTDVYFCVFSFTSLVSWTVLWYGLLSLWVLAWQRYHRMPLNPAGVGRWIGSAVLAILSIVIVGWPTLHNEHDLKTLSPIYFPPALVVTAMYPSSISGIGENPIPKFWKFAFICVTIVSWMLVWYAVISVLLPGIGRIRFRA